MTVTVIGAGLAGCEAAWQLAERGFEVRLVEMKPTKMTPAHHSADFAELVCSNSLRGDRLENAVGLLKEELRRLKSLILTCAEANRVEAGGALAVDGEDPQSSEDRSGRRRGHENSGSAGDYRDGPAYQRRDERGHSGLFWRPEIYELL